MESVIYTPLQKRQSLPYRFFCY